MQYRTAPSIDEHVSLLGYGCMRFSKRAGIINQAKAEAELEAALDAGVNYFDTAYAYPGSEEALGKFLAQDNRREKVYIATKMPQYSVNKPEDLDRIFEEQLVRLQTDHIDFYLMHMLSGMPEWDRIRALGVEDWIVRRKESGQIKNIGFSYHGGRQGFRKILDSYEWDFCQIQCNYLDANSQAGIDGLFYAADKGLAVMIMEPLRGGKLADDLPVSARSIFESQTPKMSPAAWGLRWLFDLPQVTCVLSGMNSLDQVLENCAVASRMTPGMLTAAELEVYDWVIAEIKEREKMPCTGCAYCMPCPYGVDIPDCFRAYNSSFAEGWYRGFKTYLMVTSLTPEPSNASLCVKCGQCETRCPQQIAIRDELDNVKHRFEGIIYRIVTRFKGIGYRL